MVKIVPLALAFCLMFGCASGESVFNRSYDSYSRSFETSSGTEAPPSRTSETTAEKPPAGTTGPVTRYATGTVPGSTESVPSHSETAPTETGGPVTTAVPSASHTTVTAAPTSSSQSERKTDVVYVSKNGKKYHFKSNCSNMKNPIELTLDEASEKGYTPCSKCCK